MKFLSSTSSSASSAITTTSSFDRNSKSSSTAACLGKTLRRLLCFSALPTHPFDHVKEIDDESIVCENLSQFVKAEEKVESSGIPGIVARLMGLESMPRIDLDSNQINLYSNTAQSRSMNSVDYLRELKSIEGMPRRVKSFNEAPTFLELEDEQFFILSFENYEGGTKELRSKSRNLEMGFGELKQRRAEKCENKSKERKCVYEKSKENQDTNNKVLKEKWNRLIIPKPSQNFGNGGKVKDSRNVLCPRKKSYVNLQLVVEVAKQSKPINRSRNLEGGRSRKKKKKENNLPIQEVERECDSKNSSPVSVLDFEGNSRLRSSNTMRTLLEDVKKSKHLNPCNRNSSISADSEAKKIDDGKCFRSKKKDLGHQNYVDMWGEVYKLAETDMKQSRWMYREKWKVEDFEQMGGYFELEIMDQMLVELVYQLVGTSQESS